MKRLEVKKNGFDVAFVDIGKAGLERDVCMIQVKDYRGEIIDEAFITLTKNGKIRKEKND